MYECMKSQMWGSMYNNCGLSQELRQIVRDLDRATRVQIANLNRVHANPTGPGKRISHESQDV
jgi:hypothetical protein